VRRLAAAGPVGLLGLAAILLAWDFPPIPGQAYGPGLFPTVLGVGLVLCGIGAALQPPPPRRAAVTPRGRLAGLCFAAAPLVVILAWDLAGWPLIACVLCAALLLVGGARPLVALLAGVVFAAVTWVLFAMLLRVPLPRGPLFFLPY
jgi:putative tricarboxylic transport membrane protein